MNRRMIIGCFCWMVIAGSLPAADRKPNVLLIYTDDQGTIDLNCYGAKDLQTPNLDALARGGVRFTQMYAPSAICSASRAGLLTGRAPLRAGVPGNVSSAKGNPGMPPGEVTIAEMLKQSGYATAHVGKWHLGYTPETMPGAQGFDYTFGHMGGCIDNYSHFFYWNGPNRHDLWRNGKEVWRDGEYFPDLMVREAIQFMDANQQKPFFVYWPINVPHYPMQGTAKWREHYRDMKMPRRAYAEMVSTMDECVGRLLAALDKFGLSRQTLVIFQSDHGHSTEQRAFFGGGNAGPYRGAKGCLFEGGLRVPSIVSLPGVVPQNVVRDQMATGCDWLPTIANFCGVPLPKQKLDGRSLNDVIMSASAQSPHASFVWQLGRGDHPQWAAREGDWKLLGNPRDTSGKGPLTGGDKLFLANLARDKAESRNLAKENPGVVERLKQHRAKWLKGVE
ncbi:MAG: sulfatase-like hydrolase/transferase [Pirellulales bacterium]